SGADRRRLAEPRARLCLPAGGERPLTSATGLDQGASMRRTFRALRVRNFRLFLTGQTISLIGTWMQFLGQEWLIYDLTGNGSSIGITVPAQFLPVVVLASWAGHLADKADKRRILIITQAVSAVFAVILGTLTVTGLVEPWMVIVLAVALGT